MFSKWVRLNWYNVGSFIDKRDLQRASSARVCVCVRAQCERVWSPCLHLFHCGGFIVSEHLFDKGLEGFEMSLVSLRRSLLPVWFLLWRQKMKIRTSCAPSPGCAGTVSRCCTFHFTSQLIYLWHSLACNYWHNSKVMGSYNCSEWTCPPGTKPVVSCDPGLLCHDVTLDWELYVKRTNKKNMDQWLICHQL